MKLESPVKRFPGYVILPEFLTLPQVKVITEALGEPGEPVADKKVWAVVTDEKRLPAIFACVNEWHLSGVPEHPTVETFPYSPVRSATQLVRWLFDELIKLWTAEEEIPNA